jgi:hypothetical protein
VDCMFVPVRINSGANKAEGPNEGKNEALSLTALFYLTDQSNKGISP